MTIQRYERVTGQYAKAVVRGDTVYTSGLVAEDWDKDIAGQTREILHQLDHLFDHAGTSKAKLLTMTVYLASFDDYEGFKKTFEGWVDPNSLPARATVRADLLDPKIRIEIVAMAAI